MTPVERAQPTRASPVGLDRPATYAAVDASGMRTHLEALAGQVDAAWQQASAFDAPAACREATAILVAGMGGSAIGADLLRGLYVDRLRVPLVVWRDYGLPAWVSAQTLVIASSFSGGTAETLSAVARAQAVGAPILGITTGGALADTLTAGGYPLLRFTYEGQPRAALGYSFGLLLGALARLRYLPDQSAAVASAVASLHEATARLGPAVPAADNGAKLLALALRDRLGLIYGGGFLAPVARRWKGQLNENAKHWAAFDALPELNHNAVMGYAFPHPSGERIMGVLLRSSLLPPELAFRGTVTLELLTRAGIPHSAVDAWGDGPLAHLLTTVAYGDWTSYYLALLNGIDPTGIAAIDYLKARLAARG